MLRLSFAMTEGQLVDGTKSVTRRLDRSGRLSSLEPGARLLAVNKVMGFRRGERARILGEIEVVSVSRVLLADIDAADVEREGFGGMSPGEFIDLFCRAMKCKPDTQVTRLEFRLIPGTGGQEGGQ